MGDFLISKVTNSSKDFYKTMGPFLSRREIVKEIGNSVWDDDGKVWYLATRDGRVCGFVAALKQNKNVVFGSDYVLPDCRAQGAYKSLSAARLADYHDDTVVATVTGDSLKQYIGNGFTETGTRGKYHTVKRVPE